MSRRSLRQAQVYAAAWTARAWLCRARTLRTTGDHTAAAAAQDRADAAAAEHRALTQSAPHTYEQLPLFAIEEI